MSARGFTLVELLVASVVSLLIAGAALILAGAARTALLIEPATVDLTRRLREAADVLAAAVTNAGGEIGFGTDRGSLATVVPALRLVPGPGATHFAGVSVIRAIPGGRGRLLADQAGAGGVLVLDSAQANCPASGIACGFRDGDAAVIFDGRGHFDVFIVAGAVSPPARMTPRAALGYAYPAGARVVAVQSDRIALLAQPDGSGTLTRTTAAGAREPLVDGVTRLEMRVWGRAEPPRLVDGDIITAAQYGLLPVPASRPDPEGIFPHGAHCMAAREGGVSVSVLSVRAPDPAGLALLPPEELNDGPWCPHDDAPDRFDADWFRVRRVGIRVGAEVLLEQLRGPQGRLFARAGTGNHDTPRWVRDRELFLTVAVSR